MQRHDEVDRIVAAWAGERPDLDLAPLEVFSRVSRLARHLEIARRHAFSATGLEGWEFDVLSALRRAGAPYELTPGRLIDETLVSSGTMTNRIDRLASKGLVTRAADTGDRRVVRVRLTREGQKLVDGAMGRLLEAESEYLTPLTDTECAAVAAQLRTLLLTFEEHSDPEAGSPA